MSSFKKILLSSLTVSLILFGFIFNLSLVQAQVEATPAAKVEAPTPVVYEQDSFSRDIRQLKLQYRGELEEYRNLENLYRIAKNQYYKLDTLASLEEAVQKTQQVMVSRDKVLITYLKLLRLSLLSQAGIELPAKKAAEQSLLTEIQKLEEHQQQFEEVLDKPQLLTISGDFELLIDEIEDASYQALSAMAIGRLQTVHDKATTLKKDMEVEIATAGGALKSAERKRSFDEVDRELSLIKPEFDIVEEKFATPDSSSGYKGVFQAIERRLGTIHSSLARSLTFLKELLKS